MDAASELIALSYCSTVNFEYRKGDSGVDLEVARILMISRRNNHRQQIGGVLHFGNGFFFQYLEGPAAAIDRSYAKICQDSRHVNVQMLAREALQARRFDGWAMKFVAIERVVQQVLSRHGMTSFDPYRFTPAIIDDLVVSFTQAQDQQLPAESTTQPEGPKRGLLARLFSRFH